jgi:glycosyltransferase involved in cell wall biosynthesis
MTARMDSPAPTAEFVPLRLGMSGQNIVCFAKEWNQDPTSCDHVLRELAKSNRVLWMNSISTRSPNLASGRDLKKIARRLLSIFKGATQVGDRLWLFTPFVLPFHNKPWAAHVNRFLLRLALGLVRRKLGMRHFQLWTFVPTSAEYVGHLGEDLIVYYCTDDWTSFSFVDARRMATMIQSLATRADVVFATARPLVEKLKPFNREVHLASHGVKYSMFASALDPATQAPPDLAALPRPRLGFYGLIEEWMDLELIRFLAERNPGWQIVLIGKKCVDTAIIDQLPNVHLLGRKPHDELPAYCSGLDVALIPHKVNELTRHMNPIKLREYLSAGLPIVATDLPELRQFPDHCRVAESPEQFEAAIRAAMVPESPEVRRRRSDSMRAQTWDHKVVEWGNIVLRVQAAKNRKGETGSRNANV